VFDYGCGRGRDVRLLRDSGVSCLGWDPHYFPATGLQPADVVNLGYVINVVERPAERAATLRAAWALCRKALIVSARTTPPDDPTKYAPHGDGVLTSRGTFQKFFRPGELRDYIESTLDREAVPVERGVHYVFRERRGLLPVGVKVGGVS
jgi:DNA phosphorothioation-associated putative methyltransferase